MVCHTSSSRSQSRYNGMLGGCEMAPSSYLLPFFLLLGYGCSGIVMIANGWMDGWMDSVMESLVLFDKTFKNC